MLLPGLKTHRERRGWTQQELANVAGLNVATVARAEQGAANTRASSLVLIADALDVSVDALVGRSVPENTPAPTDASPASSVRA